MGLNYVFWEVKDTKDIKAIGNKKAIITDGLSCLGSPFSPDSYRG